MTRYELLIATRDQVKADLNSLYLAIDRDSKITSQKRPRSFVVFVQGAGCLEVGLVNDTSSPINYEVSSARRADKHALHAPRYTKDDALYIAEAIRNNAGQSATAMHYRDAAEYELGLLKAELVELRYQVTQCKVTVIKEVTAK